MTDENRMERQPIRRVSRTLNLSKPAPRKCNLNDLIKEAVKAEDNDGMKTDHLREEKENKVVAGKRATRGLKLEKPAPLKSSKVKRDDTNGTSEASCSTSGLSEQCSLEVQEQRSVKRARTLVDTAVPLTSAEDKASKLIKEALVNLDMKSNSAKPFRDVHSKPRLKSVVSEDSGIGDMSWYSRQDSVLKSLSENQDDLDWNDIDDSAQTTFTLGYKHMECLPTVVNKVQPFNSLSAHDSLLGKEINSEAVNGMIKMKRSRKFSYQNKSSLRRKPNFTRSYSVPAGLSNCNNNCHQRSSMETEFWDEGVDFSVPQQKNPDLNNQSTVQPDRVWRFDAGSVSNSDTIFGSAMKREKTNTGDNSYRNGGFRASICDNKVTVIPTRDTKHSCPDFTSFSEDWEADVMDLDNYYSNPSTSIDGINSGSVKTKSAINDKNIDADATPKAESLLTKFVDMKTVGKEKNPAATEKTEHIQYLQNCDSTIEVMKTTPSYQNYRDKKESDISSTSTVSLKDGEDFLSQATSEDLDEQKYAWDLIEDLSERVDSLKLNSQNSDKETLEILNEIPPKENLMPFDIDEIEAELNFMTNRDDIELSESFRSEKSKYINSLFKTARLGGEKVVVIREPLHPFSSQEEVWRAEEAMPAGYSTAKGRRGMFRYYRNSLIDQREPETSVNLLQYSAEELLELGTRKLSKQRPDSWPYLIQVYPDICLKQVCDFDAERYSQERDYVAEVHNVVDNRRSERSEKFTGGRSLLGLSW